ICLNRWVMVLQVMAVPVLPFDGWPMYFPSWQEIATTLIPVTYGIVLISLAHRYLPLFPQEQELNPMETIDLEKNTKSSIRPERQLRSAET
ncbi:MAG: hypothetical protein ACE5DO_04660, partial [Desulfobacterales bacterium]